MLKCREISPSWRRLSDIVIQKLINYMQYKKYLIYLFKIGLRWRIILSLLTVLPLSSCDKKEESLQNLTVNDYYEIPCLYGMNLFNVDESDHYTISIEDTNIIHAKIENGQVHVDGIKKGSSKLYLLDEASSEIARTSIKVVDTYFVFLLNDYYAPFSADDEYVFFIKNDSSNFYTYNKIQNKITNKGFYNIEQDSQENDYSLVLHLEKSKEKLQDFKFKVRGVPEELLHLLINNKYSQAFTPTNSAQEQQTRSNQQEYLELTSSETGLKQILWFDFIKFPYHIL